MSAQSINNQSFIYKFLLSPRYRVWRYAVLFIFFGIVSSNQALVSYYNDNIPGLGNHVYLIILVTILIYIVSLYVSVRFFIPRYLSSGSYFRFALCIIIIAFIFTLVPNIVFLIYQDSFRLFSTVTTVDNLSAFTIYLLCISGVFIPIFLRNWILSNQRLAQLEKKQLTSEVEELKEQINPSSFFKILNCTSSLVKTEPQKASTMLMKLSQLLRYQLYDCNRTKVFLTAEITFLRNFLELESLYSSRFNYNLTTMGDMNAVLMPPSILLPYIQSTVNTFKNDGSPQGIYIHINSKNDSIDVDIQILGKHSLALLDSELSKIKERLGILYKDQYILNVVSESPDNTEVSLKLKKV